MFFDKIKSWFVSRRAAAKHIDETRDYMHTLENLTLIFESLNKFRGAGLIYVDFKHKAVTIDHTLATHFIYDDNAWEDFLRKLELWATYIYSVNEYQKLYSKTKADAEVAAFKENPALTHEDRKLARLRAVAMLDEEEARKQIAIPDLQFVVLGSADGEPICVAKRINGEFTTTPVD